MNNPIPSPAAFANVEHDPDNDSLDNDKDREEAYLEYLAKYGTTPPWWQG